MESSDRHCLRLLVALVLVVGVCIRASAEQHVHKVVPPSSPLAGESLYQLNLPLTSADGRAVQWPQLAGKPVVIALFYASCEGVCPLLAFSMQRMERVLAPRSRERVHFVMVSFDPARDSTQRLRQFAQLHGIGGTRWLLARTPERSVRELAAALGVRYRESAPGVFNHSALITLLDRQGRIVSSTSRLDALDPAFLKAIEASATGP